MTGSDLNKEHEEAIFWDACLGLANESRGLGLRCTAQQLFDVAGAYERDMDRLKRLGVGDTKGRGTIRGWG